MDGSAAGQPVIRISAEPIEPARRAAFISEEISARLVGARAAPRDAEAARFDYAILDVGRGARLVEAHLAALDVERSQRHLADGDDNITLFVPLAGELLIEQGESRVRVAQGGGALVTNGRRVFTHFPNTRLAMLQVARDTLSGEAALAGAALHADADHMLLLRSYMLAVLRQAVRAPVPAIAACHLRELVRLTFEGGAGAAPMAGAALHRARVAAMRDVMVTHHGEPRLDMRAVAARVGLSERSGYAAFHALGQSFAEELAAIRLDRALALLRGGARRILDVALDVGFADLSHFNRRFRARFGFTPREARAAASPAP
ncbi:helix-turn-helix transcriptional regulator [Sphingomonas morindae]|uniref:Helix-turn-helix transcriptional regulator n=1 Tax=Sphingomonas morindae TaxID=1541170 RepID=A0ABY4XDG3_9SPHN|nr:AraC family transcriptional regulator [Sphingomonas morindae]USI74970.1 helix-turn-helix transcriptional regulator [Sphingomonas morindae]